jgi:hypothetical protein
VQPLGLQPHFPVPPAATAKKKKKKSTFTSVALLLLLAAFGHDGEQLLPHLPVSMAKL